MSLLSDPGFETGGIWTLSGSAAYVLTPVHAGAKSLYLRHRTGVTPQQTSSATSESIPATPGEPMTLRLWAYCVESDPLMNLSNLRVEADLGSGSYGLLTQLLRADHRAGWVQSAEINVVPVGSYVKIRLRTSTTAESGIALGEWYADTVDLLPVGAVAVAKHLALSGLVTRLKAIDGSGAGYYTDLGDRVYTQLFYPEGPASGITLPYACVPLVDDTPRYTHRGQGQIVHATWTMRVFIFVAETSSNKIDSSAAVSAAKVHDDVWRAIMEDLTLGGAVRDLTIVASNSWAGDDDREAPYGEVQFAIDVTQVFQRSDLGPSA